MDIFSASPGGVSIRNVRIGKDRILTDGQLWQWLAHDASPGSYTGSRGVSIKSMVETIKMAPTFDVDAISFCSELSEALRIKIDNGFDPSYLGGQDVVYLDYWKFARKYASKESV